MAKKSFKLRNKNMSVNSTGIFAIVLSKDSKKDIEEICDEIELQTEAFLSLFQEQIISD
jgi:hypothetical protein